MQVTQVKESDTFVAIGGGKAKGFKVATSAAAFRIMSDTLYRDKERATVREVLCNAIDANIAVGLGDQPIEVTLTDDELIVKDQGPGIPDEKIDDIYCTLFGSTKAQDKRMTGGFGLGSKAPFSITDHFTVVSCHEGTKTLYAMVASDPDNDGEPSAKPMMKTGTMEQGLTVSVPLGTGQRVKVEKALSEIAIEGGMAVILNGKPIKVPDYAGMRENGYGLVGNWSQFRNGNLHVLYANVLYPLDDHEELRKHARRLEEFQAQGRRMVLCAPPSSIGVTPSREALSYDDETVKILKGLLNDAANELEAAYRQVLPKVLDELMAKLERHELYDWVNRARDLPYPEEVAATAESIAHLVAVSHARSGHVPEKAAIQAMLRNHTDDMRALRVIGGVGQTHSRNRPRDPHYHTNMRIHSLRDERDGYLRRRVVKAAGVSAEHLYRRDRKAGRLVGMRKPFGERYRYVEDTFPFALTIAPTVTIAQQFRGTGYFLITTKMKQAAIDAVKARCAKLKIPIIERERPVELAAEVKPPKEKVKPQFGPPCPPLLYALKNAGHHGSSRRNDDLVVRHLYGGAIFQPVAIYTAAGSDKHGEGKSWIGPRFTRSSLFLELADKHVGKTAIVRKREDLDHVMLKGLPRIERIVLDKLKARVKRRKSYEGFYAKLAMLMAETFEPPEIQKARWVESQRHELVKGMLRTDREFAHAALGERYKPDAERDEAYELWFLANLLFRERRVEAGYFDKDEAKLMVALYDEWRTLATPLEVRKFSEVPLWKRDGHLRFLSTITHSHQIDGLSKKDRAEFLFIVNALAQRHEPKKEKV